MTSVTYNTIHSILNKDDWNLEEVKKFLEKDSSSINSVNYMKETPLLCILKKENCTAEVIKLLLKYGADVNYKDEEGISLPTLYTALAFPRRQDIIKVLLEKGVNVKDSSAICHALSHGASKGIIKLLLDAGCPTNQCTAHASVLHCALAHPSLKQDVFQLLIDRGADVKAPTSLSKISPVICAALRYGNEASTIQLLMDAGASLNECPCHTSPLLCVTDPIVEGTPLKAEVIQLLIQSGTCVDVRHEYAFTPVERALHSCECEAEAIRLLVDSPPGRDLNGRYFYLLGAMEGGHYSPAILKFLMKHRVGVNEVDSNGDSALHFAVRNFRDKRVIRALLESGAEVNRENNDCDSPLMDAIKSIRGAEIFEELLAAGAFIKHCKLGYSMRRMLRRIDDCLAIKVFLRYFFIQNFFFDIEFMFRLGCHSKALLKFRDECKHELQKMKLKQIGDDFTLYEFVGEYISPREDSITCKLPGKKYDFDQLLETIGDNAYPQYFNIIATKIGKPSMKKMLEEVQVYTVSLANPSFEEKIVLKYEIVCNIARFSEDSDLLRMILAFYNPRDNPCTGQASNEKNNHSQRKAECASKCEWPKLH